MSHPLDVLPLFRRWPSSPLRNAVYTGIWNSLIALVLVVVSRLVTYSADPFMADLWPTLVISNVVGYLIHGTLLAADRLLGGWPRRASALPRLVYHVLTVMLCVLVGIALGTALLKGVNPVHYLTSARALAPLLPFAAFVAFVMFLVLMAGERRSKADALAARQSEQIANAGQLLAEVRLRALQAQIEPHFLYNTLANVVGLIDTQPAQAKRMLERFIDFLRASLDASRADAATLGAELDMAAAYLDVLAVRMGERLRYRFEVADGCRALRIAPMLLQPVIENAVAHGLEPKVEGGEIIVRAAVQNEQLTIEVIDSGAGLGTAPPKPGGGVGLSNLRARLRSIYGGAAQVQLLENESSGITVRLVLPLKEPLPSTIPVP
jgi:sensor histidine kinase YesM